LSSIASASILFHRTFSTRIKQFLFNLKSLFLQVLYHADGNRRENYDDRVLETTAAGNLNFLRENVFRGQTSEQVFEYFMVSSVVNNGVLIVHRNVLVLGI
jgi:hypothetical protein